MIISRLILTALLLCCCSQGQGLENLQIGGNFSYGGAIDTTHKSFPDTLMIKHAVTHTIKFNSQRIFGLGMTAAFGALSYYFHNKAETSYCAYLRTGKISEMEHLFSRAERFDQYAGWSYFGAGLGFIITALSFYEKPIEKTEILKNHPMEEP